MLAGVSMPDYCHAGRYLLRDRTGTIMTNSTLLLFLITCVSSGSTSETPATKTNVLLIMADDLRTDLESYGARVATPNLTRLSKSGRQFDRAYCQQALCNPSRSSLLTGLRPDTLKHWNNGKHFRDNNPGLKTLPQWFKEHGYESRCVGKIFHNWHTPVKGDPVSWSAPEFLHYANHADDLPKISGMPPENHARAPKCECRDVPDNAYFDGQVAEEAIKVLGQLKEKLFFLAVGFWKPHAPFNAPKKYWDLYNRNDIREPIITKPENAPEIAFHDGRELRGIPPNQVDFTREQIREMRHGYLANISYLDAQVGKLMKSLDQLGLGKNTIVIFLSDHGYHLGEHTLWAKTSCFELDARVPMIINHPGIKNPGMKSGAVVESLDLFPTLIELCNLPFPGRLEGKSLVPILKDPSTKNTNIAFTQHPRPAYFDREPSKQPTHMGYSIRTEKLRYTEWRNWKTGAIEAVELYNHESDPNELANAYRDTNLQKEMNEARDLLQRQFPRSPVK